MRRSAALLLSLAVSAAFAPAASGQATLAPPGQSAIDEYLETVPSYAGNTPARGSDGGTPAVGTSPVTVLDGKTLRALRRQGADGRAAAAMAGATAPPGAAKASSASGPTNGTPGAADVTPDPTVATPKGDRSGVLSAFASSVTGTDEGGSGVLLPILLLGVGLLGLFFVRRRRASGDGSPA